MIVHLAIFDSKMKHEKKEITEFQEKVYALVLHIPKGRVTTYANIAKALNIKCAQAVGQALRRNPYAPTVPCHRVIQTKLSIGGFMGQKTGAQIDRKTNLLQQEGVPVENSNISSEYVYSFPTPLPSDWLVLPSDIVQSST